MSNASDQARLANAVLEGVAFAHADGLRVLREAGTQIEALTVIGGGARSAHWGNILSSALGVRLEYREGGEVGPALGAARLAMIGAGGASIAEACPKPPLVRSIEPDPALAEKLAPNYTAFRAAYPALAQL
jgi:xylulokinase